MSRLKTAGSVLLLVPFVFVAFLTTTLHGEEDTPTTEDSFYTIVQLDDHVQSPQDVAADMARRCDCSVSHVYDTAIKGFAMKVEAGDLMTFMDDTRVESVSKNRKFKAIGGPGISESSSKGDLQDRQKLPAGIDRVRADDVTPRNSADDVNVAIIDTGIDRDHPDLDVVEGTSTVTGDPSDWDDSFGHGTHVAGTVAANDDGEGVVGVAPEANLYAVRVLSKSRGSTRTIVAGIDWVAERDIDVANMSLGGPALPGRDPMHGAIKTAVQNGTTFAVAAGNDSENADNFSPARYDEVITVSATADTDGEPGGEGEPLELETPDGEKLVIQDDAFAPFSNYGEVIDVAAPGVSVLSTWAQTEADAPLYRKISGTSMASPHVAGVAALLSGQVGDSVSPERIQEILVEVAMDAPEGGWKDDPDNNDEPMADAKEAASFRGQSMN